MIEIKRFSDLLNVDKTPEYYEELYPARDLPEGARVTRIAPSPTGYLHVGVLFVSMVNRIIASSTGGVFYTRIEDTDKKREVAGGIDDILAGLDHFGIKVDEGFLLSGQEGKYAPYRQSERGEIYRCFAKKLLDEGLAYPCFCSEDELAATREKQEAQKQRTGYYGTWARCRDLDEQEAIRRAMAGEPFVVRLKSPGSEENRIFFEDGIKGKIEMPENDEDFVILKSDGIPTYHFAHAVDDHLMRTTHVIRGDEWISSTPKHIQLFKLLGFKAPKYAHVAPLMKPDGAGKRKISKRKDPEAAVHFFIQQGLPESAIIEYFMSIAASDFEDWRRANPKEDISKFKFNLKKMSVSGALFDSAKLNDISKNLISAMDTETVVENIMNWAKEFDTEFYNVLAKDLGYTKQIFGIDRGGAKPRKDLSKWMDAKEYCSYFFDELYDELLPLPERVSKEDAKALLSAYAEIYSEQDDKQQWFEKIKEICPVVNFAADMKAYKQNPENYRGNAADAASVIRSAVTGRLNTPDLCSIMQVLGKEKSLARIEAAINKLN